MAAPSSLLFFTSSLNLPLSNETLRGNGAEEEAEWKSKGETKKEKQLVGEKGHVKPTNFLDSHEKFLLGVATKGVVKLFNAVNKAQNAQKGLNPSRFKDAKGMLNR
ncbi:hypothetical protein NE237_023979 [Protea cynaroides]|uniref:RRP15-like protein n=1 Tax=Protea cynaroides TaxID=273540 RepID=A0A9Q0K6J3_9MAGN|nr:hypothetical protein NE237_023979 [Protea cynaroides]